MPRFGDGWGAGWGRARVTKGAPGCFRSTANRQAGARGARGARGAWLHSTPAGPTLLRTPGGALNAFQAPSLERALPQISSLSSMGATHSNGTRGGDIRRRQTAVPRALPLHCLTVPHPARCRRCRYLCCCCLAAPPARAPCSAGKLLRSPPSPPCCAHIQQGATGGRRRHRRGPATSLCGLDSQTAVGMDQERPLGGEADAPHRSRQEKHQAAQAS